MWPMERAEGERFRMSVPWEGGATGLGTLI